MVGTISLKKECGEQKMKFLKSKLIQKPSGRKRAKYRITLEVTDVDIEKLEDLATCYTIGCETGQNTNKCESKTLEKCDIKPEYRTWLKKTYHEFWKLWKKHDEDKK